MIEIVHGDLLETPVHYICHQVNCQGVMGSGVAKQIRDKWPVVFEQYKNLCDSRAENRDSLLGEAQMVKIDNGVTVVNIFGQYQFGRGGRVYSDIDALWRGCKTVVEQLPDAAAVAMPYRIACGLGGGDWGRVLDMLTDVFKDQRLILYKKD